jgi:hypothetical protein
VKSATGFSQRPDSTLRIDTIILKQGQILKVQNRTYVVKKDTAIPIPSYIKYEIKPSRNERFYSKLAQRANKNRLTRELHNIIIAHHQNDGNYDTLKTNPSILPFVSYRERVIRHIKICRLDVFGPTVNDTSRAPVTWIGRTGNKLHIQTKERLIRNNLLFKEGARLKPVILSDNERLLRGLPYLEDAKIIVQPISELSDSVDILVIAKDVWANAFDIKINDMSSGTFQIWDRNILGFGHEIQNNILWDSREKHTTGYNGIYTIYNIGHSFFQGQLIYFDVFNTKSLGISVQRNFLTPNIKYAGGGSFFTTETQTKFKSDSLFSLLPLHFNTYDFWLGRSFLIRGNDLSKTRRNITIATRLINNNFFDRPEITENSYYNFQNKTLILSSISYTKMSFFKSNFIYNYGRTEDIPIGFETQLTAGFEKNEFFNRRYGALLIAGSSLLWNLGYVYSAINLSGFYNFAYHENQGIFKANLHYFSPIILIEKFRLRQFIYFDYTRGINRFQNEFLSINNSSEGIAGYTNDSIRGNQRLNIHCETVCFTPFKPLDFHFVIFAFADVSWIGKQTENIFERSPYSGLGLGIRIRNERLVFNTIQIRFTFYPNIPKGSLIHRVEASGESILNLPSFQPNAPSLVPYQ